MKQQQQQKCCENVTDRKILKIENITAKIKHIYIHFKKECNVQQNLPESKWKNRYKIRNKR